MHALRYEEMHRKHFFQWEVCVFNQSISSIQLKLFLTEILYYMFHTRGFDVKTYLNYPTK